MSTRSKVKRQVRRNVREHTKARARRELRARWQRAEARGMFTCSAAYWLIGHEMRRADAEVIRFALAGIGGPVIVPVDILSVDMGEGGPMSEFKRIVDDASEAIGKTLLGPSFTMGQPSSHGSSIIYQAMFNRWATRDRMSTTEVDEQGRRPGKQD